MNQPRDPTPGSWYLGVRCAECDEIVLWLSDASQGQGPLRFEIAPSDPVMQRARCMRGHWNEFPLYQLRRFQWRPRLNS